MKTTSVHLDAESEITLSVNKVKELVEFLSMDQIVDSMIRQEQIKELIERLCMDHWQEISNLLFDFFNHKPEAGRCLSDEQREELMAEYQQYLSERYKL